MKSLAKLFIIVCSFFVALSSMAAVTTEGSYEIDNAHTNVGFKVSHMGISLVVGRFNAFNGSIEFEPNGQSTVSINVDTASVDTNNQRRDRHLRSGDFFNATVFPKMTYVADSVEYDAAGDPQTINGKLTLLGVTKDVPLNVTVHGSGTGPQGKFRVGYEAVATIKRTDFGMDKLLRAAGDEVDIVINIELIKK